MTKSDDFGKLILRVTLGVLILLHGVAKLSKGVDSIGGMLASHGLPAGLAYLAYIGEVVAPLLLIIGLFTRPAAWIVAIHMLFAFWLAHMGQLGSLNTQTGGWALELQGMFLASALAVAFLGGGRYGIGGRFN